MCSYTNFKFFVFVLRFYSLVNPMGSCRAQSVYQMPKKKFRFSDMFFKKLMCAAFYFYFYFPAGYILGHLGLFG